MPGGLLPLYLTGIAVSPDMAVRLEHTDKPRMAGMDADTQVSPLGETQVSWLARGGMEELPR